MLDIVQFAKYVVAPALQNMNAYSPQALVLVTGTCVVESNLTYVHQLGTGPALGLAQMEPFTCKDCWDNFLKYRKDLGKSIWGGGALPDTTDSTHFSDRLVYDMCYAVQMCRVKYMRAPSPLPAIDATAMATEHKNVYNSAQGAADISINVPKFESVITLLKVAELI